MELVVLFVILALLIFGPRRGGRKRSYLMMILGALFLLWFVLAMGIGWIWRAIFGDVPQP